MKGKHVIRLERDTPDHILPMDFYNILVERFVPILGLSYVISVLGMAYDRGDFLFYGFLDKTAYIVSLFVIVWISIPAILWIFLRGSIMFCHIADFWYKIISIMQVVLTTLIAVMFPEADMYGMKVFFIEVPVVFLLMYFFMVRGQLPLGAAYAMSVAGLLLLFYGASINLIFGYSG